MAEKNAWLINLGEDDHAAHRVAAQLHTYGLTVKGQHWPAQPQAWLVSAQEAAEAGAAVVLVSGPQARYDDRAVRRGLALFRLALQSRLERSINGFTLLADPPKEGAGPGTAPHDSVAAGTAVLDDWVPLAPAGWQAKLVARAHAPAAPTWPVRLGLHAHERLGVWLEVHPVPDQSARGALVGVAGNQAKIDFHAVGPAGRLPPRTVNEYELQGLEFDASGHAFSAWGLRNPLTPADSYYVRLDGEPDMLAIGELPDGDPDGVHLVTLG